jgi:hypothetical protein
MKKNHWGDLVLSKEEYKILKEALEEQGVNLNWSASCDGEYDCYVRNPWKEAGQGWGDDLVKRVAKEHFERYNV